MIVQQGDLFSSTAAGVGHGVNTAGVMGAGIAKSFRARWPGMYAAYRRACLERALLPGQVLPWADAVSGRWVYNLASQDRPGPHARVEWVRESAQAALVHAAGVGVEVVALPQIGCGIGGLEWGAVAAALEAAEEFVPGPRFEVWTLI